MEKLDYTLKTPEERTQFVSSLINNSTQKFTPSQLDSLTDYILAARPKEERFQKQVLTDNRLVTVNRRETSYEELVSKFENGEDGVYNLIAEDHNMLLQPKISITQEDIETVPGLKKLTENIAALEAKLKTASRGSRYLLKKQIIEFRKEQYVLKNLFKPPMRAAVYSHQPRRIELADSNYIDENGEPQSHDIVTLFNPDHVSALLRNYEIIYPALRNNFQSDFHYLLEDLRQLIKECGNPVYVTIIKLKIRGKTNAEIQAELRARLNVTHSIEYISTLWRNKIPATLAEAAKEKFLIWYYTEVERGNWKKCGKCGQVKLAHPRFFSRNSGSKDGYYSVCKECRSRKPLGKSC